MDYVILNHGQVTWTTPELTPPLLITSPYQREDVSALDRFNVPRYPTRRVLVVPGLNSCQGKPRPDTFTTRLPRPPHSLRNTALEHKPLSARS
ncbi:hypothetical protein TNCV_1740971 [Trichonephila clavipes]|uniref:Uncharacterized protein n=1 Tax=Trichonephila clavipes TaxID=2585209 RepID=A0A8X6V1X6_TRICX|nr:hypothetical protein TNCV_1740971 [Trichonephila clavipes]